MGQRGAAPKVPLNMDAFWSKVAGLQDKDWKGRIDSRGEISLFHPELGTLSMREVCRSFELPSVHIGRVVEASKNIGRRHKATRRKLCRALGLPIPPYIQ